MSLLQLLLLILIVRPIMQPQKKSLIDSCRTILIQFASILLCSSFIHLFSLTHSLTVSLTDYRILRLIRIHSSTQTPTAHNFHNSRTKKMKLLPMKKNMLQNQEYLNHHHHHHHHHPLLLLLLLLLHLPIDQGERTRTRMMPNCFS